MKLEEIPDKKDFILAIGNFLDEFKLSENKYEMICDEPQGKMDNVDRCVLAAISHKLANDFKLNIPAWVSKPDYILPLPVYSFGTTNKDFQKYLENSTPFEFASRNIFYSSNAMERV